MVSGAPFTCTWLFTDFPRTDRVVLEANTDHWNRERGPRLEKVVYVNDIDPAEALEKVCDTEGEIDIVSEVSPGDARRVQDSEHANLVTIDALRVVSGLINRNAEFMDDVRVRKALNLAVDRDRLIYEVFARLRPPRRRAGPALLGRSAGWSGAIPARPRRGQAARLRGWLARRTRPQARLDERRCAVAERARRGLPRLSRHRGRVDRHPRRGPDRRPEDAGGEEHSAALRRAGPRLVRPRGRLSAGGHPPRVLPLAGRVPGRTSHARVRGPDGPLRRGDRRARTRPSSASR